jgi:outer membrane protein assembly factor BamD (BamD/ComL family)
MSIRKAKKKLSDERKKYTQILKQNKRLKSFLKDKEKMKIYRGKDGR